MESHPAPIEAPEDEVRCPSPRATRSPICAGWIKKLDQQHAETSARLDRVESRLDQIADELLVLNGIVLRLEDQEMETTGLKAMLDGRDRWLGKLGCRVAELEGAPND
jgi:hypothetical protein